MRVTALATAVAPPRVVMSAVAARKALGFASRGDGRGFRWGAWRGGRGGGGCGARARRGRRPCRRRRGDRRGVGGGHGQEGARVGGGGGGAQDEVVAALLLGALQGAPAQVDQRVGPVQGADQALRQADPQVAPDHVGHLVHQDVLQVLPGQVQRGGGQHDGGRTHAQHQRGAGGVRHQDRRWGAAGKAAAQGGLRPPGRDPPGARWRPGASGARAPSRGPRRSSSKAAPSVQSASPQVAMSGRAV